MVNKINDKEFNEKINVKKKVIVDCYADWCGPCKMLSPIIDELAEENNQYDFYKLNVDESNEITKIYGIMSIPTVLIFQNGELINQVIGFRTKDELKYVIDNN